jgi:hypothetical protein
MDQSTQRLGRPDDLPAWRTECLRCHTAMLEMDVYDGRRAELHVRQPTAAISLWGSGPGTGSLRALVCPNCGCTELFTPDLAQLLES